MSAESVAQDQIRAFVNRILRLKEEAKSINGDIREVYAEAKGNGFDKTVLGKVVSYVEKRAAGAADLAEAEALFDLYLSAYDGASHTHAYAREQEPTTTKGGDDESRSAAEPVILDRRLQDDASGNAHDVAAAQTGELQRHVQSATNHEPAEGSAEETSATNSEVPAQDGSGTQQGKSKAALPASVDASVSDDVGGVERSNITPLRTHNPATHFLNSKGLPRLHGCKRPDSCGSEQARSRLCFSCSVQHDGPAHQDGAA